MARARLRGDDREGRRERALAIVSAAADLVRRWGYDKTTIDDIATRAGVAKGTIYLHWRNRDALLTAVLLRERYDLFVDVRAAFEAEGGDLGAVGEPGLRRFLRHLTLGLTHRPLLKSLLVRDLGALEGLAARRPRPTRGRRQDWNRAFADYLQVLREHGAIRPDVDDRALTNTLVAVVLGAFVAEPMLPAGLRYDDSGQAELVADVLQRALGPSKALAAKARRAVARETSAYLDRAIGIVTAQLDESLGLDGAVPRPERKGAR